jgi:hypothetical protein
MRPRSFALVFLFFSFAVAVTARAESLESDPSTARAGQSVGAAADGPNVTPPGTRDGDRTNALLQSLCATIRSAATDNGLPVGYFARVIWQESRLRPDALGPPTRTGARAQGIAQFMPATAAERVVLNPFDPAEALPKSAAFLRQLRAEFGNLGLAAAAYNAGPQRVRGWLAGRRALPSETLAYVRSVTGRPAEEWKRPGATDANVAVPADTPCAETVGFAANRASASPIEQPQSVAGWVVQLVGDRSESSALASYDRLRQKHRAILGPYDPVVVRTTTGASAAAIWHRVRVAANSRQAAEMLCAKLRAAGGSCLVQHN